jgi:hypothetical protein
MAKRLSALWPSRPLHPGIFLVLTSVRGWVDPKAIGQLERLGQLKNPMTSSGIKPVTFWLVPQPTTLPRAPIPTLTPHQLKQALYRIPNFIIKASTLRCLSLNMLFSYPFSGSTSWGNHGSGNSDEERKVLYCSVWKFTAACHVG